MSESKTGRWTALAAAAEKTWGLLTSTEKNEIEAWSNRLDEQRAAAEKTGQAFPAPTLPAHIAQALATLPQPLPPDLGEEDNPFAHRLDPLPDSPEGEIPALLSQEVPGPGQDPASPHRPALVVVAQLERYASAMSRILPFLIYEFEKDVENHRPINKDFETALAACRHRLCGRRYPSR